MNKTNLKLFVSFLKVLLKETFFGDKEKKKNAESNSLNVNPNNSHGFKAKRAVVLVLVGLGCVIMLAYLVLIIANVTKLAIELGIHDKVPYFLLGATQLAICLLGMGAYLNYVFFSKDVQLLQSLPLPSGVVFAAKFTITYLSQLFVSIIILLPSLVTYGIVSARYGVNFSAGFYILSIITPFVTPLLPLLIISILSIPLMRILLLVKNRDMAKAVLSSVLSLCMVAIYFSLVFGSMLEGDVSSVGVYIEKITSFYSYIGIINYNWVEALIGNGVLLNLTIYFVIVVVALVVSIILNGITYKTSSAFSSENGMRLKVKIDASLVAYKSRSFFRMFVIKELKKLIPEPNLIISTIVGLILVPVVSILLLKTEFSGQISGTNNIYIKELVSLGFITYIICIVSSSNFTSLVGISIEGKSISLLKSLPIEPKAIIKGKLLVSAIYNLIFCTEFAIVYLIISVVKFKWLIAFVAVVVYFTIGFGMNCMGLYSDLKNPKFDYENIQHLLKNNKRTVKPMLISLGIGMLLYIVPTVLSIVLENNTVVAYTTYFLISIVVAFAFSGAAYLKLKKNYLELYEKTEC